MDTHIGMKYVVVFVICFRIVLSANNLCNNSYQSHIVTVDCRYRGLTSVPDDLPNDTQKLDLSYNNITKLGNDSFATLDHLIELVIRRNGLRTIEIDAFCNLERLRKLDISNNDFSDINSVLVPGIFKHIENLTTLDIRYNMNESISRYPSKAISELSYLTDLYMDMVARPRFGKEFKGMRYLRVLYFDYCKLEEMSNSTMTNFPENVKELHMMACYNIKKVESGFLSPVQKLTVLNIADTRILLKNALALLYPLAYTKMDVINFQHVNKANGKDEEYSHATIVTKKMMKYLRTICVKTLNMADNDIVDFMEHSLLSYDHPGCFENVVLSSNRLTLDSWKKKVELFKLVQSATNIKLFDCSYNPLRTENEYYFKIPNGAIQFTPTYARCQKPSTFTMRAPPKLQKLRLSYVFIDLCGKSVFINEAPSLEYLDISNFAFQEFSNLTFNDTSKNNIRFLNLSKIGSRLFTQYHLLSLPNIKVLDLSHNALVTLPNEAFGKNSKLQNLNLSNNLFSGIPPAVMDLHYLKYLNLANNNIQTLSVTFTNWLDTLAMKREIYVYIKKNSFICNCDNKDFVRWVYHTNVVLDKNNTYQCRYLNENFRKMEDINKNYHELFAKCDAYKWIQVGTALLVTFSVVALLAAIIFNFRWRIAYYIYRKFKMVLESDMELNFRYDAYVSYADDSEDWVKNFLVFKAEKKWGLTLCVDDRDFNPGEPLIRRIAECISTSRQVLFILSQDLLQRDITRYEIERAIYEKSNNHTQITLVNLGVEGNELQQEFSPVWQDVRLIEPTNPFSFSDIFWGELKMRLVLNR